LLRDGGGADRVADAHLADAGEVASDSDAGPSSCVAREALDEMGVNLNGVAVSRDEYAAGVWIRDVQIDTEQPLGFSESGLSPGMWQVDFSAKVANVDAGTVGTGIISSLGEKSFALASTLTHVRACTVGRLIPCPLPGQEPSHQSESALRNDAGELMLASGLVPLQSGGNVVVGGSVPELDFTWESFECTVGSGVPGVAPVRLVVTDHATGETARVSPGKRAELMHAGHKFFVTSAASVLPSSTGCGFVEWAMARSDAWVPRTFSNAP